MRRDLVVAILIAVACAAVPPAAAAPLDPQRQVEEQLMCYCGCSDLTVRNCTCGTADAIRSDIRSRLDAGSTVDQIVAAYVAEHGTQIRSAPSKAGFELLAWITPFAALLAAGVAVVWLVRRWGARVPVAAGAGAAASAPGPAAGARPSGKAYERVRRELSEDR